MSHRIEHTESSGNVFRDLGIENPEEALLKSGLAWEIACAIKSRGLTQAAAGKRMGLAQADVSRIVNGRLSGYTVDRLLSCLAALGRDVILEVLPAAEERGRLLVGHAEAPV